MKPSLMQQKRHAVLDLLIVGSTLLTTDFFLYPSTGSTGMKALLVAPGLSLLVVGLVLSVNSRRTSHRDR